MSSYRKVLKYTKSRSKMQPDRGSKEPKAEGVEGRRRRSRRGVDLDGARKRCCAALRCEENPPETGASAKYRRARCNRVTGGGAQAEYCAAKKIRRPVQRSVVTT